MLVIRPIQPNDLYQLEALASEAGVGMTTLPANQKTLQTKIETSLWSFARDVKEPLEESYMFVLEDTDVSKIVGTCGIMALKAKSEPFYSYKLGTLVHASEGLGIYKKVQALHLVNDFHEVSEICTLFLNKEYRKNSNGKLLSRCRYLFISQFPERFAPMIIAEMRGVQNEEGRSPFWRNMGMHFFEMDFSKADYLTATGNKKFISDLMPRYPIYVPLLPQEAQEVIGQVNEATVPALKLLQKEGFRFEGYVDIFDAGPTMQAEQNQIYTVRENVLSTVSEVVEQIESEEYMISNTTLDFRICRGPVSPQPDGTVHLTQDVAKVLRLYPGDAVRYIPFHTYR